MLAHHRAIVVAAPDDQARQTVSATLQGHTVNARLRVLASPREPASYLPFATTDFSEMPAFPRAPLKQTPYKGLPTDASWCGRWL